MKLYTKWTTDISLFARTFRNFLQHHVWNGSALIQIYTQWMAAVIFGVKVYTA
jgi:hypothetical protein